MLKKKVAEFLKQKEFVSVATCNFQGRPNAAPKLILKEDAGNVYLVDYTIGHTWENLLVNPRASLSFMDTDSLNGYQVNGPVQVVEKGEEYEVLLNELLQREIDLSTKRIIEGVTRGKVHGSFEVAMPKRFIIFKVKIEEVIEIAPSGGMTREKV